MFRIARITLFATLAAATITSIAWAKIPASKEVIRACYTQSGALQVIQPHAECTKYETALSWNISGPQGPKGATGAAGPQGPQGAKGPVGPSDAFTVSSFGGSKPLPGPENSSAVAKLALDAGSYVFLASVRLKSTGSGTDAYCYLHGGLLSNTSGVNLGSAPDRKIVSLNFAATLAAANTVQLKCGISTGSTASADQVFFTAIKVGSVTEQ